MSQPEPASITCPACGHVQQFTVWQTINVTLDNALKAELFDRKLMVSTCEQCSATTEIVYPLLYHDMAQKVMIWYWPEPGDPDVESGGMPRRMTRHYRLRIVRTFDELLEKIVLFDQGCDDREVELFKFLVRAQHSSTPHPLDGALCFRSIHSDEHGNDVIEFLHVTEGGAQSVDFALREYRDAVALLRHDFMAEEPQPGTWLRVDADFVHALVTAAVQQPTPPEVDTRDPTDDADESP